MATSKKVKKVRKSCSLQSENFDTLSRAFKNGDVCLMECTVKKTGEKVAVICAVCRDNLGMEFEMMPFAVMINDNPYEVLNPPMTYQEESTGVAGAK